MRSTAKAIILASVLPLFFIGAPTAETDPTFGTWSLGQSAPGHLLATHCTLLRNNRILVVGGSSYNCCFSWGKEEARLYDIATGTWGAALPSPAPYGADKDAFCSGHAHDHTGGVIFQGGLRGYWEENGHGIASSARYDVASGSFTQIAGAAAHWYPTLVAGVNHVFNFPGRRTEWTATPTGDRIHKLAYGTTSWTPTGVAHWTRATYPRVVLLPNGKFFIASPADSDRKNYLFDPTTDALVLAGNDVVPESEPGDVHGGESWKGSGVLLPLVPTLDTYPHPRFALLNGIKAWVKDLGLASPIWQQMGTRPPELSSPRRNYANATLLPTGQVLVLGGVVSEHDSSAVLNAEVYDPDTNAWLMASAATVPRNYHGVALLLPDGRVWTASGSQEHSGSQCAVEHGCGGSR